MSENEGLDIGRVVSLIMENPQLIEQIANLAKANETPSKEKILSDEAMTEQTAQEAVAIPTYTPPKRVSNNRTQLLGALKPYVSIERAKAIDSMLAIVDILEMMKSR